MPVALTITPEPAVPLFPRRRKLTRDDCAILAENGALDLERVELIDGELISKMGQNRPHLNAGLAMMLWLMDVFGRTRINQDASIDVSPEDNSINEPEPDLIVLAQPSSKYRTGNPKPADILLLVEISDTTLRFDLKVKSALYARAGITDYWVLDVSGQRLIVHREPTPEGYRSVVAYNESERVAPLAAPTEELLVGKIFSDEA